MKSVLNKKIYIIFIIVPVIYFLLSALASKAAPAGSVALNTQPYFRIYQDDAGLNSATPYAGQNTTYPVPAYSNFRIRLGVCRGTGTDGDLTTARRLRYKKDSGAFTTITNDCGNDVCLSSSANFSDGDATTQRLTYSSIVSVPPTFTAGQGKSAGPDTSSTVLQQSHCIEDEYSLKFQPAAVGHAYEFNNFIVAGSQPVSPTNPIINPAPDTTAPAFSGVSSNPSNDSATITWTTNENSSSQVEYGLVSSYGSSTLENDTSSRVLSHLIYLENLQACARYYFRVKSKDASNNQGVSAQYNFNTSGCEASSITGGSDEVLDTSGGSVSFSTAEGVAVLTVPSNFYSESVDMQLNRLDTSSVPDVPEDQSLINDNFFDLLAVSSSGIPVANFDLPVTFTVSYGSDTESAYDEKTLDVYKYSEGSWHAKNCLLDTLANTLTCNLNSFSVYGVFGEPTSDDKQYSPIIAVGGNKTIDLSENESVSLRSNKFVFRGTVPGLEKGDIVQIIKNGKLLANRKINVRKRWHLRTKQVRNITSIYQFRYLDKETKKRIQLSPEYELLVDRVKPRFIDFKKSISASPGDFVTWTATDNDRIKYYQVKFHGKKHNVIEARFRIPNNTKRGISKLAVTAFDQAENRSTKKMSIRVR